MMTEQTNLTPAMAQYMQIKNEHKDYLLFYRMGDFYELFYDDAIVASRVLDIALTKKTKDVPMCGVPFHAYESYLAKLIRNGYKVAVCEQMEDPKEAKKRGYKAVVRREVVRLVTPGTVTEDSLLDSRKNNYLLCVVQNGSVLGAGWIDLSTGEFYTQAQNVTADSIYGEISSLFAKLMPSEILVPDSMLENPQLFQLLGEYKEKLSVLPAARFNYANAQKKVQNFYGVQTLDAYGNFSKAEVVSAGVLLDYVETTQRGKMPRIETPVKLLNEAYMEIDGATGKNLELLDGNKDGTLISVIDCTITGFGSRMLKSRLAMPLTDVKQINERLDAVEFFLNHHDARENLREVLKACPDIERALSRLSIGRGGPRDLLTIAQTLSLLSDVKNAVMIYRQNSVVDEVPAAVVNILKRVGNHSALADMLLSALNDDLPLLARDGGFIRSGYSPELDSIRLNKENGGQMVSKLQAKYVEESGIEQLKIKYNTLIGYFIEVPSRYAAELLENPKYIHRQSILNAARFTTAELHDLDNNISNAQERALAMELKIYDELVKNILVSGKEIFSTAKALAELDVAAAMAELAAENNYCRPLVDESLCFEIEEGRHPVVEHSLKKHNEGNFVGNNCSLNVDTNRIWLLTGPNMAGKSTFLRQNAIIAIMAQTGVYVPAKSVHIGVVDKVFSRVGASDDLARGRSTFMVEMVETASILNRAGERSFVILDEIGRGTATFDGLSIAWAVVEYLHEVNKCRCLFATHYHELASIAERLSCLTLHCMRIKDFNDKVVFLHEVISGTADRSYGIHVAKLAGLPLSVTKRAEQVLQKLEKSNQNKMVLNEDDLPLFSFAAKEENRKLSQIEEKVASLNPDDMTAREALQIIYELQDLIKKEKADGYN